MSEPGSTRSIWQVSAGPAGRSYADVLLRHGVALIGPGDAGPWDPQRADDEFEGSFVRRFADLRPGDVLVLRTGLSRIRAVGLVAGNYAYLPQFDDVNGWDLQHARRVRWCALPEEHDFRGPVFGASPPRLAQVASPDVLDYARRFVSSPPIHWQSAPLPALPQEEPALTEIPGCLLDLVAQANDLAGLYWDRAAFGEHPTEDEMVAHFVVPLLRALGWPPERIAIKWRYIDVCLFRALPRTPENCYLIMEVKRLGAGVEGALEQAKGYLEALGVSRNVVVTDGLRYRMYAADRAFAPLAYANLPRLKRSALKLFDECKRP